MTKSDKKYIVFSGPITSKNDKDVHHISANQLIKLYNVKKEECIILNRKDYGSDLRSSGLRGSYKILEPRYSGDYSMKYVKEVKL